MDESLLFTDGSDHGRALDVDARPVNTDVAETVRELTLLDTAGREDHLVEVDDLRP